MKSVSRPATRTDGVTDVYHRTPVPDPYRWLEAIQDAQVRAWIDAQNAYKNAWFSDVPGKEELRKRLESVMRLNQIDCLSYVHDGLDAVFSGGNRYFYSRLFADKDQSVICMRESPQGKERVLLDPARASSDRNISYQIKEVSPTGRLLLFGIRRGGEDEQVLKLFDVDSGAELPDPFPLRHYTKVCLFPDETHVCYGTLTEEGPRVYLHRIGQSRGEDEEIFGEGFGPEHWIEPVVSPDGNWFLQFVYEGAGDNKTKGIYFKQTGSPSGFTPIVENAEGFLQGRIIGHHLYLRSRWNAPNGQIVRANLHNPSPENWEVVVPESAAIIEHFSLAGGRLFVLATRNAASRVKVFDLSGKPLDTVALPDLGTVAGVWGKWEDEPVFFCFESFLHPKTVFAYYPSNGKVETWSKPEIPVDPSRYEVKQVQYPSKDGTIIPMFLVHKRGLKLDGTAPFLLTAYGGFGLSQTPYFDGGSGPSPFLMAEMGGVFAVANIRGGGEFGETWHKNGMLEKKQNSFDDFMAAAEWLIANHYTSPKRLAIAGGSNGGLLVGAACTQRPDLFAAVICSNPLLDMLRYQKFYLGPMWISEYGASDDPGQFHYLMKYSPYHNVKEGSPYPAVLLATGDGDTRVHPMHALKMTARLQEASRSDNPVLLSYDTLAGHSPGMSLTKRIDAALEKFLFLRKTIFGGPSVSAPKSLQKGF